MACSSLGTVVGLGERLGGGGGGSLEKTCLIISTLIPSTPAALLLSPFFVPLLLSLVFSFGERPVFFFFFAIVSVAVGVKRFLLLFFSGRRLKKKKAVPMAGGPGGWAGTWRPPYIFTYGSSLLCCFGLYLGLGVSLYLPTDVFRRGGGVGGVGFPTAFEALMQRVDQRSFWIGRVYLGCSGRSKRFVPRGGLWLADGDHDSG